MVPLTPLSIHIHHIYYIFAERSPKKKLSQPGRKGAIIVIGKLSNDKDSTLKEPEKSDDAPSTSKVPEKADDKDSDSSSVSSPVEVTTPRTPSPVPKPSCCVVPSSSHIPTLETASPVTKPREEYGALSFPRCDHDWYDNLCELQYTDAQQMTDGKDDQSGKLGLIIVPMFSMYDAWFMIFVTCRSHPPGAHYTRTR